jgi:hypothetical protein
MSFSCSGNLMLKSMDFLVVGPIRVENYIEEKSLAMRCMDVALVPLLSAPPSL